MGGGVLHLLSASNNETLYFIGNPQISFFYTTFNQFCNFGMQKFRIDYLDNKRLTENASTEFVFNVPRQADLLNDTYLVIDLPNIWSPIFTDGSDNFPYEFRWIKHIGSSLIEEVEIYADGTRLQNYTGQYLRNMVERDFEASKKELFNKMTGHVPEMYEPARSSSNGFYPNASAQASASASATVNPSINRRSLYIPLNSWFSLSSYQSLPLISTQYNNIYIKVRIRQLRDLYTVRDLDHPDIGSIPFSSIPHIKPPTTPKFGLKNFMHPPTKPAMELSDFAKLDNRMPDFNIHLICTQTFLDERIRQQLANFEQTYLIKEVRELNIYDIVENSKIDIESHGLVTSWMWYMQRSDVGDRNEWANYTNLKYEPLNRYGNHYAFDLMMSPGPGPLTISDPSSTPIYITPDYEMEHERRILNTVAILCDGAYRENTFEYGVFDYIEKYTKTGGGAAADIEGLYCYNFTLNSDPTVIQPYGLFNTNFFKTTEMEITTIKPEFNPDSQVRVGCDATTGEISTVTQTNKQLYNYTFNFVLQEERYNILTFKNGMVSLKYAY